MTDTLERDVAQRRRPQRKRRSRWATMLFIVLLISLGLVATGVLPIQQYLERETQVNDAQKRLDTLVAQNDSLESDATALLSDQEIERIAREQYGYVLPGEIGYVVAPVDGADAAPQPAEPVSTEPDDRGLLQRVWDFIAGRDVTGDG